MDKFKEKLRKAYGGKYHVAYWETRPHEESGELVIHVGLSKAKLSLAEAQELPTEIDGIKVVYEYSGEITALTTKYYNPLIGGVSIGAVDVTAGTFGGIVRDKEGRPWLLTNEHVVSDTQNTDRNHPPLGHKIVQPGPLDGGVELVGDLYKVGGMKLRALMGEPSNIDAALVGPVREFYEDVYYELGHIESLRHAEAEVGDHIVKVGRTTGVTYNVVGAVGVSANIGGISWGSPVQMEDLIMTRSSFVQGGDSGSRVWKVSTGQPIGLVFAGSMFTSMIIPAQTICDAFGVTFGEEGPGEELPLPDSEHWIVRFFRMIWEWLKKLFGRKSAYCVRLRL